MENLTELQTLCGAFFIIMVGFILYGVVASSKVLQGILLSSFVLAGLYGLYKVVSIGFGAVLTVMTGVGI